MNFKKKLLMMSLAASLVVPSNLALIASVTTPVFAEAEDEEVDITNATKITQGDIAIDGTVMFPQSENHTFYVPKDTIISFKRCAPAMATIILEEGAVLNVEGSGFDLEGSNITIKGKGTIKLTNKTSAEALFNIHGYEDYYRNLKSVLNISGVTIDTSEASSNYGIAISEKAAGSEVNLTDVTMVGALGIAVNGGIEEEWDDVTSLTLTNVNIRGGEEEQCCRRGIYQAGYSVVTLKNTQIKAEECGIEIRGGTLNIGEDESDTSHIKAASTLAPQVKLNDNGATTLNAGIAVAPYTTDYDTTENITVNINGGTIEGSAALVLSDPQTNKGLPSADTHLTINENAVLNSTFGEFKGKGVLYTSAFKEVVRSLSQATQAVKFDVDESRDFYTLSVVPPILEDNVSLNSNSYTYTGSAIKPEVTVTVDNKSLVEDTDYEVSYAKNTNAGTGTVTIEGKGNYTGTITKTFTIEAANITDTAVISGVNGSYVFNGDSVEPEVTVRLGDKTLAQDTDYEVTYANSDKVGSATVTVKGKGNYTGTITKTFTIEAADITDTAVISGVNDSYVFNGDSVEPEVTVELEGKTLAQDTDYEVTYTNSDKVGSATVTVKGKGNYTGTITKLFTIEVADITNVAVISGVNDSYILNGDKCEPVVTVTVGGKTLTKDTDYEVTYTNSNEAGTATVTVTGTGNYTGSVSQNYTINNPKPVTPPEEDTKTSINGATIVLAANSYTHTGDAIKPTITSVTLNDGTTLTQGTDYTVGYSDNINVGTGTVTLTGTGSYEGTASTTFSIVKATTVDPEPVNPPAEDPKVETITDNDVILENGPYLLTDDKCEPVVTVTVSGKTLVAGTDYEVSYSDSTTMGIARVTVTGKGNYEGTITKDYRIQKEIVVTSISLEDGPYTLQNGKNEPQITVTVDEKELVEGTDYTKTYTGSQEIGDATVTVTGIGNYTGVASKTYVVIDESGNTVNIVFGDSGGGEGISINIPKEYLVDKEGNVLEVTNENLATALTKQSADPNVSESHYAPQYEYHVEGFENSSQLKAPKITFKVKGQSIIRLILKRVAEIVSPQSETSEIFEVSEVSLLSDEILLEDSETNTNEVVIYATLDELDNIIDDDIVTKEEVEAYIASQPQYSNAQVPEDFPDQDFSSPLKFGNLPEGMTMSDDGFIEISAQAETVSTPTKPSRPSSSGSSKPSTPTTPEEPSKPTTVGNPTTMYRLYNRLTGEHIYTTDKAERDHLLTSDTWKDEGQGWTTPDVSDYPVYRLLNPNTGDHHYTTDKNEFETLPTLGWVAEGIAFFSADKDDAENVILHRLYNPNAKGTGSHHYTVDTNERDTLVAQGWTYEGTAWAGLKSE